MGLDHRVCGTQGADAAGTLAVACGPDIHLIIIPDYLSWVSMETRDADLLWFVFQNFLFPGCGYAVSMCTSFQGKSEPSKPTDSVKPVFTLNG